MKMYRFSLQQNAHNIELVKYVAINDDNTDLRMKCNDILRRLMYSSRDGKVALVDGKTAYEAYELSTLGSLYRTTANENYKRSQSC
jgi:hypothetical protein